MRSRDVVALLALVSVSAVLHLCGQWQGQGQGQGRGHVQVAAQRVPCGYPFPTNSISNCGWSATQQCPAGSYQPFTYYGAPVCYPCPGGHVSLAGKGYCTPCPTGRYVSGTECAVASGANYQPNSAQNGYETLQLPAAAGQYTDGTRVYSCGPGEIRYPFNTQACRPVATATARGYVTPWGTNDPVNPGYGSMFLPTQGAANWATYGNYLFRCPPGTYADDYTHNAGTMPSQCVNCPSGTFNPSYGMWMATSCQTCTAGKYWQDGGGVYPLAPPSYPTSPIPRYSQCTDVPAGYQNTVTTGAVLPMPCEPGTYSGGGSSSCATCSSITYTPKYATPVLGCLQCPDGWQVSSARAQCVQCASGQYSSPLSGYVCTACAAGTYAPAQGSGSCTPCPAGFYSAAGWQACRPCPAGTYTTNGQTCTACPVGTFGADVGLASCPPCANGRYTALTGQTNCTECSTTTVALACMTCSNGKFQSFVGNPDCSDCDASTAGKEECCPKYRTCQLCPAGRMASYSALPTPTGSCAGCEPGKYQPLQGQTACAECPDGQFSLAGGEAGCTTCRPGTYSNSSTGHSVCGACEAGKYSLNGASACSPCGYGNYSVAGASVCSFCGAGTFTAAIGTITCSPCGPGKFVSGGGASACSDCPAGQFTSDSGRSNCSFCPIGKFQDQPGSPNCTDCGPGRYADSVARTACSLCSDNAYFGGTGATACDYCALGSASVNDTVKLWNVPYNTTVNGVPGKGVCATCPSGSFADRYGLDACMQCSPGSFASFVGNATCQTCPAGMNQSEPGMTACHNCTAGRYQSQTGQLWCNACPAGRSSLPGAQYCFECPFGRYSRVAGAPLCSACTATQFTENAGATRCTDCTAAPANSKAAKILCSVCQPGTFRANPTDVICTPCPVGYDQPNTGSTACVPCTAGKFATTPGSPSCQPCLLGTADTRVGLTETCRQCPPGSYADSTGMLNCLVCPKGSFARLSGTITCSPCPVGSAAGATEMTDCTDCEPGKFASSLGSWNCTACPLGKASSASRKAACTDCPLGYKANVTGLLSCLPCPAGTSAVAGQSTCTSCLAGTFSFASGSTSCLDCPVGRYNQAPGLTRCEDCAVGYYASSAGSSQCVPCPAGSFTDKPATLSCPVCTPGKFNNATGATVCTDCPVGSYRSDTTDPTLAISCTLCPVASVGLQKGQPSCVQCPAGTDTNGTTGQTNCVRCPAGRFSNYDMNGTAGICVDAPAGSVAAVEGLSYATPCERGRYQSEPGQLGCLSCEIGKSSGLGAEQCFDCPRGTFANVESSSSCVSCQPGTYAEGVGSQHCSPCPDDSVADNNLTTCLCRADYARTTEPGFVRDEFAFGCRPCPEGADCREPGANYSRLLPQPGYWPAMNGNGLVFVKCVNGACMGGEEATQCRRPGYGGNLCTVCDIGYGRSNFYDCDVCPPASLNRLRLVGFVVVLLFVTIVITRVTLSSSRKATKSSILLKILLSNLQFNALALGFAFTWPASIQAVFNLFDYGSNVTGFISVDCFLGESNTLSPFYIKTAVVLCMLPAIILIPALLGFLPYGLFERFYYGHLPPDRVRELRDTYISGITIVLFLLHPNVTSLALSMFSCIQLGTESDDIYLIPDMSQQCYTSFHKKMILILTLPLVALFVVGIPLAAFLILWSNRHQIEYDSPEFKERFGFLYNGYKTHFWYWEFAVVTRKVLLVAVSVYFSENQNVQALMAVFLCAAAMTAHAAARPFSHTILNTMEFLSLTSSFFTFFFGQFLFIRVSTDVQLAASVIVLFVNLGYVLLVIGVWVYWFKQKLERLKKKQAKKKNEKDAARKVPWTEGDWRFHLQDGTVVDEKEREHALHSSDAPVNGMVAPAEPVHVRSPRHSVVVMAAAEPSLTSILTAAPPMPSVHPPPATSPPAQQ